MKSILLLTVLASMAMFSFQITDERRMALTKDYYHARRMGFTFPQQFCQPAKETGVFILDTAIVCAVEAIIPGSGKIAEAIKAGKKVADTLGVMSKITELKTKAENFVMSKFLGIFGCKVRRRAFGLGDIGGAIKGAAGAVAGAAGAVLSKAKDAAGAISSAAKAAAKVVCPVVKPMCPGACSAAITAFKAAGTVLAATYHIPLNCLSGALEKGCNGLCKAICGRRRLGIKELIAKHTAIHGTKPPCAMKCLNCC